jgi:phage shock protein PspC (stress-responsive transcriptional regulator)
MHKVIVINLNGNAYQVDEVGYDAVRGYLDRAAAQLRANPDLAEIMADLEQAIAEKCQRYIGPHKTVVSAVEMAQILAEMGPVEGASDDRSQHPREAAATDAAPDGATPAPGAPGATGDTGAPKRLYLIHDGAMFAGVCNGIAAYLHVDVTLVRIVFVVLALITKGFAFVAYLIMMVVIPYASTSEEHAAAKGLPFNAQEVVDWKRRWKGERRRWRQQFKQQQRAWRRAWPQTSWAPPIAQHASYSARVIAGTMIPILGLVQFAMLFVLVVAIVSLARNGAVFGWALPPDVPLWVGIVGVWILYWMITAPVRAGRHAAYQTVAGWHAGWAGMLEMVFLLLFLWLAYTYVPPFRDLMNGLLAIFRDLIRTNGGGTLRAAASADWRRLPLSIAAL